MTKKVILISGKAGHGKTLFADNLEEVFKLYDKKVLRIAYADYLKFILQKYFNWDGKKDEKGRALLQRMGTNVIRAKHPNFWVDTASNLIRAIEGEFDYVIIDDVRFLNEVECFEPSERYVVRMERYNMDGSSYDNPELTLEQKTHESETSLDDYSAFDFIVENRTTPYALSLSAYKVVEEIIGEHE